jgi:hypothetical protein
LREGYGVVRDTSRRTDRRLLGADELGEEEALREDLVDQDRPGGVHLLVRLEVCPAIDPHHDHLVESEVSKPVAADRSIVAASRNHSDYLLFLLAMSDANCYTYSSSQTMLPQALQEPTMPETVVHFQIRMPPVLHERLASWAKEDKASLNALVVETLQKAVKDHESDGKTIG